MARVERSRHICVVIKCVKVRGFYHTFTVQLKSHYRYSLSPAWNGSAPPASLLHLDTCRQGDKSEHYSIVED